MERFEIDDRVVVLERFAHLYPSNRGVVTQMKLDQFRAAFNEYKIEFSDGSTADLFEFQIRKAEE